MQTREELLNNLNTAVFIIRKLSNIQQRLNQVRSKYQPYRKMGKIAKFTIGYFLFGAIVALIMGEITMVVFGIICAAFIYIVAKYIQKQLNIRIDKKNESIKINEEQPILNDLQKVQVEYREYLSSWYPENYCSVDAVEFFYNTIKNYRADSLKEAINLYETALHQRRVEANQEQSIKQQKLNNLLSVGSLVMQGATLSEMKQQNIKQRFAMEDINRSLDDIRSRLH